MCALFACFGVTLATWAVHLPSLQRATGMSTAMLGTVLLVSGGGALAGMQVCGPLADRWGSGRVATIAGIAMTVSVTVPLAATSTAWALGGALLFGMATGSADVAMNAAAVAVERLYGRPIMSSFHAVFSMGNVAGALFGTAGFALNVSTLTVASTVAAGCAVLIAASIPWLRTAERSERSPAPAGGEKDPRKRDAAGNWTRRIFVLGILAFLLLLSEGSAMDWSSLHAQQHLGASPASGAIAFGVFVTAMTVGRLCVDRIAHRIGPVATLRRGCAVAALGIVIVIGSPVITVTLIGWLLFGLGLAGGVPQVFTAAGNLGVESGRALARVVGVGYVAMMAGPAIIGWLAEVSSLTGAMVIPLCAVVVCAAAAPSVGGRT